VAPGANIGTISRFGVHGSPRSTPVRNRPLRDAPFGEEHANYMGHERTPGVTQAGIEAALKNPETRTKDLGGTAGTKEFTGDSLKPVVGTRPVCSPVVREG